MNTDIEAIAHLDFELKEDKAEACRGWSFTYTDTGEIAKAFSCASKAEAVLIATRVCCGSQNLMCLNCYNEVCRLHAKHHGGIRHSKCDNLVEGKPYLSPVKWL